MNSRARYLNIQIEKQLKDEREKRKALQKKSSMSKKQFVEKLTKRREANEKEQRTAES